MVDFTPNFTLRITDSDGVGVAVDGLQAEVYNQLSELVYTPTFGTYSPAFSPSPEESPYPLISELSDADGTYYEITGLDLADPSAFPGSLVSINWRWQDATIEDGASWKAYSIYPLQARPAEQAVLTWEPATEPVVGYQIEAMAPGETEYTIIGFSAWPVFVDTTEYASVGAAQNVQYVVRSVNQALTSPASSEFTTTRLSGEVNAYRTEEPICIVSGRLADVTGQSHGVARPLFYVHDKDTPLLVRQTLFHEHRAFVTTVAADGSFAAPLVRGALVTLEIAAAGYALKFVVPDAAHADISVISGTQQNIRRAD